MLLAPVLAGARTVTCRCRTQRSPYQPRSICYAAEWLSHTALLPYTLLNIAPLPALALIQSPAVSWPSCSVWLSTSCRPCRSLCPAIHCPAILHIACTNNAEPASLPDRYCAGPMRSEQCLTNPAPPHTICTPTRMKHSWCTAADSTFS